MNWHRVAFTERSHEYLSALAAATGMGAAGITVLALNPGRGLSIWAVDTTNAVTARETGMRIDPLPDDLRDDTSYLYFAPGAMEAFRSLLPADWLYEPCSRPPMQMATLMFGDQADWRLFANPQDR